MPNNLLIGQITASSLYSVNSGDKLKPAASTIKILVSLAHQHCQHALLTVLHLWIVTNLQWLFSEISLVSLVYSNLLLY